MYWYQRVSSSRCCFLPSTIKISLFQPHVSICLSGKVPGGHKIFPCNHFDTLRAFNTIRKWDIFGWLVPHTDRWLIKMIWLCSWCTVMQSQSGLPPMQLCDVQYTVMCKAYNIQCAIVQSVMQSQSGGLSMQFCDVHYTMCNVYNIQCAILQSVMQS